MARVHLVRTSERHAKRRCPRAWDLRWRQGWRAIEEPQAPEFGTAWHAAMEVVYEPSTWDATTPSRKLLGAVDAFKSSCDEQRERYLAATSQTRLTWDGRDDYENRLALGTRMLEYYVLEVHPVEDRHLRPAMVEVSFRVPIIDEHGEPLRCRNSPACGRTHGNNTDEDTEVFHEGRVDGLFEDTERGGYYAVDSKTIGGNKAIDGREKNTSRFSRADMVWMHDQLGTYCWALRYVLGIDVRGFILAETRKDYPRPPERLKRNRNGGVFSTDRNMPTTLDVYRSHVVEYDPHGHAAGAYDEFLEYLGGKDAPCFHKRFREEKSKDELRIIGENLVREVRALLDPKVQVFPTAHQMVCPWCEFRAPCEMMMRGMDHAHTLESMYERHGAE